MIYKDNAIYKVIMGLAMVKQRRKRKKTKRLDYPLLQQPNINTQI